MTTPLPAGFGITFDPGARQLAGDLWSGGSPARVLRLTPAGRAAWRELAEGPVTSADAGALARKLTDAGFAHPVPPETRPLPMTIVIPVHGRIHLLAACLDALDGTHPVLLVDDASEDPGAVAALAASHGAKLIRREVNGGPSAARNTGLEHVSTPLVAFLDSDTVPTPGWADRLAAHFADPLVAAVAPQVRPIAPGTWAGRYAKANSSLDLGDRPARVAPGTRMSYVPTAALVARRSALEAVARGGAVFDPAMWVGEDVDLVWRLHAAGFRVRYEPSVHIGHNERATWRGLLGRRFFYGTSAAPLACRRPDAMAPLILHLWPSLAVAGGLARRPVVAGLAFAASVLSMRGTLRKKGIPAKGVVRAMGTAVLQTWLGTGRYSTQFATPLLAVFTVVGGRRRWGRRAAVASLLLGPPLSAWLKRKPGLDPARYTVAAIADDIAYGAGVWVGCGTQRTTIPLRPAIARRSLRVENAENRGTS